VVVLLLAPWTTAAALRISMEETVRACVSADVAVTTHQTVVDFASHIAEEKRQ
jgi:hypothetical protein